jgi:hypothetical protein
MLTDFHLGLRGMISKRTDYRNRRFSRQKRDGRASPTFEPVMIRAGEWVPGRWPTARILVRCRRANEPGNIRRSTLTSLSPTRLLSIIPSRGLDVALSPRRPGVVTRSRRPHPKRERSQMLQFGLPPNRASAPLRLTDSVPKHERGASRDCERRSCFRGAEYHRLAAPLAPVSQIGQMAETAELSLGHRAK